jgi:hypothetical protein
MSALASLRQLKYPKEFRIAPAVWPPSLLATFEKLVQALEAAATASAVPVTEHPDALKERMLFVADVGTGLWRLRQKMIEPGTDRPLDEMRRAYRHFESVWDALTQAGVQIQDHTDAPYDSGMSLKVIAFQPMPGLRREKVIETIKPTIYYKEQPIQMGEVIVGTPDSVGEKGN